MSALTEFSKPRPKQPNIRLKVNLFLEVVIFCLSTVTIGLIASFIKQLSKAPLDSSGPSRFLAGKVPWSQQWGVFFYGTVPFLTVLISLTGIALYITRKAGNMYGLIVSAAFTLGWGVMMGLWFECGLSVPLDIATENFCYQRYLIQDGEDLNGVSSSLRDSTLGFSLIILVAYLAYLGFSAKAVVDARKLAHA